MSAYAEFAVTTNFSFLRGGSRPEEFVVQAKALALAGIGIADRNSVAGVVRAHMQLRDITETESLKPVHAREALPALAVGARLVFADGTPDILAYPQDRAAWARLTRLLTVGKSRGDKAECILFLDDLIEHQAGLNLIVMPPPRLKTERLAATLARLKAAAKPSLWLGASVLYRGDDTRRLNRLAEIARDALVPLIAVNDALYHAPERRALQDVVTCIREHATLETAGRRLEANAERHLKPAAEMERLFRRFPDAVAQTAAFLSRCRFSLEELRKTEYPEECRAGFATPQEALVAFAEQGARERFPDGLPDKVRRALDHELAVTAELNYAPYFLTVHDIVRYARSQGILCQGRGSAANSVICYCLNITEVDPNKADLLFERFVSAERREPPDIDVDFEHERREEVIQYIYQRYGRERAGLTATVISYRGRSAVREVGKVFGLSDDVVGKLASTLWGWSMDGVAAKEARRAGFDLDDPRLKQVLALSQELIGFPRHLSQHVGGFAITRSRLDEVVPVENAAMEDRTVIEWNKDDLDGLGLLKVDILGLGMLTCLRWALDLLRIHYGNTATLRSIYQDERGHCADPAVYRMLSRADSVGVFQVESRAQMSMLPRLKPEVFYDLVIEVAIVRPGPIQGNMVHPYLQRRERLRLTGAEPTYPSPAPAHGDRDELKAVLHKTLGVPLFQEQAMRIAIVAAKFPPAKADRLRRAMATFKRVGTIERFRGEFVAGMTARGYDREFAVRCFSQIEGFGEYGFPESHAASFALLVYASAWVKCFYPDVFAAALLNSQPMGFYAPAQIVRDAQEHGVEVRGVDVNFSDWDCSLEPLACAVQERLRPGPAVEPATQQELQRQPALAPAMHQQLQQQPTLEPAMQQQPQERLQTQVSSGDEAPPHGSLSPCGGGTGRGKALGFAPPSPPSPTLYPCGGGSRLSPRHAEMADDIRTSNALRLGLRQISGLSEQEARRIEAVRGKGFDSVRDLWLRTGLAPATLERLAAADAFRSLGLDRRDALWAVKALRRAGDKDDLPLFAHAAMPEREPDANLPPMRLGEQVIEDYRHLRLSLKAHPVSFLRADLSRRDILRHEQLAAVKSGQRATVAGLVLVRQRPGDAKAIFMTLEDETGIANVIVWLRTFETYRPVVLGARLISVTGKVQNESGVIHVIAERLEDLSPLLRRLSEAGQTIDPTVPSDMVKRPDGDGSWAPARRRHPRAGDALVTLLRDEPALAEEIGAVMPKGRNFH